MFPFCEMMDRLGVGLKTFCLRHPPLRFWDLSIRNDRDKKNGVPNSLSWHAQIALNYLVK